MRPDYAPGWMPEKAKELEKIIAEASIVVITAHRNADPDAVASTYATKEIAERILQYRGIRRQVKIVLPEGISHVSKRIIEGVFGKDSPKINSFRELQLDQMDVLIVVDTASRRQLGGLASLLDSSRKIIVIDHHGSNELVPKAYLSIYDPNAKSSSELVYMLSAVLGINLSKEALMLLLAGIVYDTRHFLLSSSRTLRVAADIIDSGISLDRVLKLLQHTQMDISEKIARLKAAARMTLYRADDILIAVTKVGAFEASSARALLDLGADIAIIVSEHNEETRIIARGKQEVLTKLKIHLGKDLLEPLGKRLGGSGGGHQLAAGASARTNPEKAFLAINEMILSILGRRGLKVKRII